MHGDGLRIGRHDRFDLCPSLSQKCFRFAARNKPGMQISSAARIDPLERVPRRIPLIQFNCQTRLESGDAMCQDAAGVLWNDQANTTNSSTLAAIANAV